MSDLTPRDLVEALEPLALLAYAPVLDGTLYAFIGGLLASERVTRHELRAAIAVTVATETRWSSPATLLKAVRAYRVQTRKDLERVEHEARLRQAQQRRALPAGDDASRHYSIPPGYPPAVGPPLEPVLSGDMKARGRFGPVRDKHGQPDPFWPELPGRPPAWQRKMRYDHGLSSWQQASALTTDDARRAPGPKLGSTTGVRPLMRGRWSGHQVPPRRRVREETGR